MALPLVKDPDALVRMEHSLMALAVDSYRTAGVDALVYGVFSLDELERKAANELGRKVAVGVQYAQSKPLEIDFNPKSSATASGGGAVRILAHEFLVVLAVPTDPASNTDPDRYNVSKLLTLLRRRIHGELVDGDLAARRWNFQWEKPNVGESSETVLYYTQLWQVALPLVGPN